MSDTFERLGIDQASEAQPTPAPTKPFTPDAPTEDDLRANNIDMFKHERAALTTLISSAPTAYKLTPAAKLRPEDWLLEDERGWLKAMGTDWPISPELGKELFDRISALRELEADLRGMIAEWRQAAHNKDAELTALAAERDRYKTALEQAQKFAIHGCGTKQKDVRGKQFGAIVDVCTKVLRGEGQ